MLHGAEIDPDEKLVDALKFQFRVRSGDRGKDAAEFEYHNASLQHTDIFEVNPNASILPHMCDRHSLA